MFAKRSMRLALVLVAVLALAVTITAVDDVGASSAGVRKGQSVYYLDVGASVSVGVQPTPLVPQGQPTNEGYANLLVKLARATGVTLHVAKIGCPGESTLTLITGHDPCYRTVDNQLSDAVAYLQIHHSSDVLVTIDLGFNDVVKCLRNVTVNAVCVRRQMGRLQRRLPTILKSLTLATGPNATLIGVGHYNPFLATAVTDAKNTKFAHASEAVIAQLNSVLKAAYAKYSIPMADVAGSFRTNATTLIKSSTFGLIPTNVATICASTWMCTPPPYGPNLHPNDAGYRLIARSIMAVMPVSL